MISLMPLPALPALTHTVTMRADPIGTTMNVEEAENEKYKIKSVKLKTGHVMKYICPGQNGPYAWFSSPPLSSLLSYRCCWRLSEIVCSALVLVQCASCLPVTHHASSADTTTGQLPADRDRQRAAPARLD